MSLWGKLLGGVAGFALGGPFGAAVGAAMGHAADTGQVPRLDLGGMLGGGLPPARLAAMGDRENLFALSVTVLAAKLAKVDGPVNRAEIDAFKRLFRIPPESARAVGRLFDQARDTPEGFESYAAELGRAFSGNKARLEEVLTALFAIARADRAMVVSEHEMLWRMHHAFGLDTLAWDTARGAAARPRVQVTGDDPYAELGANPRASNDALRATWLQQVRENHPDSMTARGVSAEQVARAGEKVAKLNAAWDRIKRERGL